MDGVGRRNAGAGAARRRSDPPARRAGRQAPRPGGRRAGGRGAAAPSRLADDAVAALGRVVGAEHALGRRRHRGSATPVASRRPDLLSLCGCTTGRRPRTSWLVPGSHDEVMELLRICSERRIAVVPFGGGTSVVGGLEPDAEGYAGVAALDVRRLNALESLDEESRVAQLGARSARARGRGAAAAARLHDRPLPAVVRVRHARRVRRGALERPVLGRLRSLRRPRRQPANRDAGRDARARARAQVGRRAGPATAGPRLGGRVRRDHLARDPAPARPGGTPLRGLATAVVRGRRAGRARGWPRTVRCRPCCGSPTRPRRR